MNEIQKWITDHDLSSKYITTQEFYKLTSKYFASRLAQANLARENDIADFVQKTDFDDKLKNNKKNYFKQNKHVEFKTKLDDLEKMLK